jgi:integrase
MRIWKPIYRGRDGKTKTLGKWWIELRDQHHVVRRFPAFKDKTQSRLLGDQLERLVASRIAGQPPSPELTRWLEHVPAKLRDRLVEVGLLDGARAAGGKPIMAHLDDFSQSLRNDGNTDKHVNTTVARITRVMDECQVRTWSDISATAVQQCIANLKDKKGRGLSAQSRNYYLQACQQFARWMVLNRRATESPIAHLRRVNAKPALRHERTAFEIDEIRRLLAATAQGPERYGMSGNERALLYRVAVETGLRANELRTLTVSSFNLEQGNVTVLAAYSKHREQDVIPLRPEMVAQLKTYFSGKLPGVKAFGGRYKQLTDRTSNMLREDLTATEERDAQGRVILEAISYTDAAGRYRDFHALRHTCGSWLGDCGVHPKQIQEIMRHKDINLTMTRYGHSLRGRQAEAVAKLPDLSLEVCQVKRATGTDDSTAKGPTDLARNLALLVAPSCTTLHGSAQTTRVGAVENGVLNAPGGIRTPDRRIRNPLLYPTELRAHLS